MALVTVRASVLAVAAACFVVGAGLGFVATPTLIAAQSTVGWSERGVVTGTNMFSRSIGSAIGVAVFGAIANASLGSGGSHPVPVIDVASHHVFEAVAVVAVLMTLAVALMPRRTPEHVEATALGTADLALGPTD